MKHHALLMSMLLALSPLMGQEEKVKFDPVTGAPITTDEKVSYDPVTGLPVPGVTSPEAHAFDPVTGAPVTKVQSSSPETDRWTGLRDAQIVRMGKRHANRDHKPFPWIIGGGIVGFTGITVGGAVGGIIMGGGGAIVGMGLGAYAAAATVSNVRKPVLVPLQLSAAPYAARALYKDEYRKTTQSLRMKSSFLGIPVIFGGIIVLIIFSFG